MSERYDLAVIGGGPVGAALALQASRSGLRVRVLESRRREAAVADNRPMALSYGSRLVLERLGMWRELAPVTPIARIHVSQTGGFGRTEMTAGEAGLPALGYVVDYACLVNRFDTALEHAPVEVTRGAKVTSIAHDADSARIEFQQGLEHALWHSFDSGGHLFPDTGDHQFFGLVVEYRTVAVRVIFRV
ncbi:MAG: FAD-dependent monooxygenase, partial [Burkholderiales bacterium]